MNIQNIKWLSHPLILEINTWSWLYGLSQEYNYPITLQNIPEEVLDKEIDLFDVVWLMGVWERSPQGRKIAIQHPDLQEEYKNALRYFSTDDVVGSPYAVHYYHVDSHLGGKEGLAKFRKQLANRGLFLLLDYVPNHVAVDHLWTLERSDIFVEGTLQEQMSHPDDFFSVKDRVYCHGKDPYFPPWTDTVQINAFSQDARQKAINTLLKIAEQCDGVRCDMAMLMMNDVFKRTWGERVGKPLEKEFWREIIPTIKERFPNFVFIAEAYWDMEWELQQQGFNYCYDKTLYDRLAHNDADSVRTHLQSEWEYNRKLLRFIENHDEQRAIKIFGEERSKASAIIILTLPGAKLIHEGQMKGNKIKLPVQLARRPDEGVNKELYDFYQKLLKIVPGKSNKYENWALCDVDPIDNDNSFTNILSYIWSIGNQYLLTVVNFSPYLTQSHIRIKGFDYGTNNWMFTELLMNKVYVHKGEDLQTYGLYIDLDKWNGQIFKIQRVK